MNKSTKLCLFQIFLFFTAGPVLGEYQLIPSTEFLIDTGNIVCDLKQYQPLCKSYIKTKKTKKSNFCSSEFTVVVDPPCKAYIRINKPTGQRTYDGLWAFNCLKHSIVILGDIQYDERGQSTSKYDNPIPDRLIPESTNRHYVMPGTTWALLEKAACANVRNYQPLASEIQASPTSNINPAQTKKR